MATAARTLAPVRLAPDPGSEQVTQLMPGEPVGVVGSDHGWVRVVAPWQPSSLDPAGYPGWVRADDLRETDAEARFPQPPDQGASGEDLVAAAAAHLGTPYQWGGLSGDGLDCSGLVHGVCRAAGLRVPRDAADQAAALPPVDLDEVLVGDLYFFARPGHRVHHVGLVAAPAPARRMLHAPDSGPVRRVLEEDLPPGRLRTLVSAARLVG